MTTYQLAADGSLMHTFDEKGNTVWHPPIEVPPVPEGISQEAWDFLHLGYRHTSTCYKYTPPGGPILGLTVFEMTEEQKLAYCRDYDQQPLEEPDERDGRTEEDIAWERDYYAGGNGASLDPFAFDSSGNDTGLRMSDFI